MNLNKEESCYTPIKEYLTPRQKNSRVKFGDKGNEYSTFEELETKIKEAEDRVKGCEKKTEKSHIGMERMEKCRKGIMTIMSEFGKERREEKREEVDPRTKIWEARKKELR